MPPGVLDGDSDYSENGPIANAREIQSEYWVMKTYTLFISISSFILHEAWLDRQSSLAKGSAVTVEPEGESVEGSLQPPMGSFFAEVEVGSTAVGEAVMYSVRSRDDVLHQIPRHR